MKEHLIEYVGDYRLEKIDKTGVGLVMYSKGEGKLSGRKRIIVRNDKFTFEEADKSEGVWSPRVRRDLILESCTHFRAGRFPPHPEAV